MEEQFKWIKTPDSMSHEAFVNDIDFTVSRYDYAGIVDRRYKSGYRVVPDSGINTTINFINVARNDRYQIRQIWQIGKPDTMYDLGKFMVVLLDIETVKLIPVSLSNNKNKVNFKVGAKMQFIYMGSAYTG